MADESQLEILRQGIASWNEWRRCENPQSAVGVGGELLRLTAVCDDFDIARRRANYGRAERKSPADVRTFAGKPHPPPPAPTPRPEWAQKLDELDQRASEPAAAWK